MTDPDPALKRGLLSVQISLQRAARALEQATATAKECGLTGYVPKHALFAHSHAQRAHRAAKKMAAEVEG